MIGHFSVAQLFRRLLPARHTSVAIEIGTDLLKIFQIREGRSGAPHRILKIVKIADLKQSLVEELPLLFQSLGICTRQAIAYLPRKLVTMRFLEVPSTDDQEVADMMRLQGIKQTPYSMDEVALAHTVVGSRNEGMSDVVLAFCQRKFVDERVDLLERSGFKVQWVGVSTEAVANWYVRHQAENDLVVDKDLVVLIDQDLNASDVVFCRGGKFVYSKGILSGSQQVALDPGQGIELFCGEVARAIEFAVEEARLTPPKKAILMASLSDGNPLRAALESRLQLPVEFCNPAKGLDVPEDALVDGGSVTLMLGFGRRSADCLFDMTPEELKLGIALEKRSFEMVTTGILSIGLFAVIGFLVAGNFYKKKEYLHTIEKEIAKTQEYAAGIEGKLARTRLMERIKNPANSFLHYLQKVASVLAPGVYFSSIDFAAENQLVLKGYARQMSEVFDFAKALEELKIFKAVKSERVSKKKEGEQVLAEFEINCPL